MPSFFPSSYSECMYVWAHLAFGEISIEVCRECTQHWVFVEEVERLKFMLFVVWVCLYCRFIWFYIPFPYHLTFLYHPPHHTLQYMYVLPFFCEHFAFLFLWDFFPLFFASFFFYDGLPSSKIGFSSSLLLFAHLLVYDKKKWNCKEKKKIIVEEKKYNEKLPFASK